MLQDVLKGGEQPPQGTNGEGRIDRILRLIERMDRIQQAINSVRYNQDMLVEIPEVLRTLGDAKEAVEAELKIV